MGQPLISVIVPVYQAEKYLDECVGSIVHQTYQNLEIILVNDGCRDGSPAICDAWAGKDRRITVIHKENGGASTARNAGLDAAKGDYIGFVDSDDYIAPDMYERLITFAEKEKSSLACCRFTRKAAGAGALGTGSGDTWNYSTEQAVNEFLLHGKVTDSFCDKLFARELFEARRFPEHQTNEEYTLFLPLLAQAEKVGVMDFRGYFYRGNESSVTNTTWKTDADIVLRNLSIMENQLETLGLEHNREAFGEFSAMASFSVALQLDKCYDRISPRAKENLKKYIGIMRKNVLRVLCSGHVSLKDKILYGMIVTRLLRPVYRALGKA